MEIADLEVPYKDCARKYNLEDLSLFQGVDSDLIIPRWRTVR